MLLKTPFRIYLGLEMGQTESRQTSEGQRMDSLFSFMMPPLSRQQVFRVEWTVTRFRS